MPYDLPALRRCRTATRPATSGTGAGPRGRGLLQAAEECLAYVSALVDDRAHGGGVDFARQCVECLQCAGECLELNVADERAIDGQGLECERDGRLIGVWATAAKSVLRTSVSSTSSPVPAE